MIKEKINEDLKKAMKINQELEVQTLRMILASLHNREIEKRGKSGDPSLTEEEIIEVLQREVKKRKEAINLYLQGNRQELAEKEEKELKIIERYLPPPISEEELRELIQKKISELGAKTQKDFGKVMGAVMKEIKGRVEAEKVADFIKRNLEQS